MYGFPSGSTNGMSVSFWIKLDNSATTGARYIYQAQTVGGASVANAFIYHSGGERFVKAGFYAAIAFYLTIAYFTALYHLVTCAHQNGPLCCNLGCVPISLLDHLHVQCGRMPLLFPFAKSLIVSGGLEG